MIAAAPRLPGTIKTMGTASPSRLRRLAWGCLGLALLYGLLLAWYFPWRKHIDSLEVAFEVANPQLANASMIFAAPSGWIFLNCGAEIACYQPAAEGQGRLDFINARDHLVCMSLAGDSLYYCTAMTGPNNNVAWRLGRLDQPPQAAWETRLDDLAAPVDVAANSDAVIVLDEQGVLVQYGAADGGLRWRIELAAPAGPGGASSSSQFGYYGGFTTRLAADAEGRAYALLDGGTLAAAGPDGSVLWEAKLPSTAAVTLELAPALGQVFVQDDSGAVTVVDCATGAIARQLAGQGYAGGLGIQGLPCVGEDGSVIMFDSNYALVEVEPGGQHRRLTEQYEYGSHLLRLADGGVLMLSSDRISVLDSSGKSAWERRMAGTLFSPGFSFSNSLLGLTPDGIALWCWEEKLYGYRPRTAHLAPARLDRAPARGS